ncbi:MAG TPA: sigma 54-interacting transcriptional regulator, partial [Thermoanaerobaculia bacterium]
TAMDIYRRVGTPVHVAEMLNRIAWIHNDHGEFSEAVQAAHQAETLLAESPVAPIHGYIKNTLGVVASTRREWREARALFAEALEIAERVGSEALQKTTLSSLGHVMLRLGEWDDALRYFRTNLEHAERDGDLWELAGAYHDVAVIELNRGNFHAAAALFEKSVRLDEKLGAVEREALALKNLGQAVETIGRWSEACSLYERGIAVEGSDDNRISRIAIYVPYARLAAKMGDLPKALQFAVRAYEAAERARDEGLLADAALVLAQIEKERENFADATRYLTEAIGLYERGEDAHGTSRAYAFAADLCFRQQKHEEALHNAKRSEQIARQLGDRFTLALTEWVSGKVMYVMGEREQGEARLASAHTALDELDAPYEVGRLLFETGLLREEPDEASQTIRRAIKIFERLDAMADLERARGALFRIKPAGKSEVVGLYEIVKIINSTLHLEEVLNRVLDVVIKRLRADRGMIYLIDPITGALRTRVVRNMKEDVESKRSPQAIIRDVIHSGVSIISADARTDERFIDSETVISENIVSTLCVPLVIRERIAGAIYVDHRETRHLFSQRDLNFLEAFADQAAIAIDNARLYEQLEEARMRLSLENETLRKEVLVDKHLDSVVGQSEAIAKIQFTIKKAAAAHSTVLLRGESGTGKGLIARIIHNVSPRRHGPFIKFNCAALPETLAESELFGHDKGAFTGADRRKLGRFELANGGTIFIDEIGKVSLAIQAKLLRVVEDKEFERVGGTQTIKSDVKIIAATNLDLERAIEAGTFREDLFYRLNIVPIFIPPLRERKEDIPLLAEHFIKKICRDLGVDVKNLEPGILELFAMVDWPGNVRELEAVLHRAIVMSSGNVLTRADFFALLSDPHGTIAAAPLEAMPREVLNPAIRRLPISEKVYDDVISSVDRQLILQALEQSGHKIRETARRLGLARNTLKAKLAKYDIEVGGE